MRNVVWAACALGGVTLAASPAGAAEASLKKPGFINGAVSVTSHDGAGDDLLTAGLGFAGLSGAAPAPADPASPTPAEIRRLAIYNNYRGLVDPTPGGGFGMLYGPGVNGTPEKVPGKEYLAFAKGRGGRQNITLLVQIPASFDSARPCIVTGPSSGSRGVYGAIATSGEWGLKKGCAVAYTDKGTGVGAHDLQNDIVSRIDGVRVAEGEAGKRSNFTAPVSDAQRTNFSAQYPNRFAFSTPIPSSTRSGTGASTSSSRWSSHSGRSTPSTRSGPATRGR